MWFALASDMKLIYKEYYMYDLNAIISSIGGGIGIFLGYSFYGVANSIINYFHNKKKKQTNDKIVL